MKKFVLISCAKKKQKFKSRAKDLYISPLFKESLAYARRMNPDNIFILSAKYGLVGLEEELEYYDLTLKEMFASEVKEWADKVKKQMEGIIDFEKDEVTFLAGEKYIKHLLPLFKKSPCVPMKGLVFGKRLPYLKQNGA